MDQGDHLSFQLFSMMFLQKFLVKNLNIWHTESGQSYTTNVNISSDHLPLEEFNQKCLSLYWHLWILAADFEILANLSTVWDIVKICLEIGGDFFSGETSEQKTYLVPINSLISIVWTKNPSPNPHTVWVGIWFWTSFKKVFSK